MITPDEIKNGGSYASRASKERRDVLKVKGTTVTYAVEGIMTFLPLRISLEEFAGWADIVVKDDI